MKCITHRLLYGLRSHILALKHLLFISFNFLDEILYFTSRIQNDAFVLPYALVKVTGHLVVSLSLTVFF